MSGKYIHHKLDDLPTKEGFCNVESKHWPTPRDSTCGKKVDHFAIELNDVQQYLRRYDLCIFNVPVTSIASKQVFDWTFEYFPQKLGVNIDEKDIDRAHRIGKERGGKVQIIFRF